jgi:hypothetical protein
MSDAISPEQIGALKDKWRQEFREARLEMKRLEGRLKELHRKLCAADEILAHTSAEDIPSNSVQPEVSPSQDGKYSNVGLTEALRSFFGQHRGTQHSISALTYRLQREGLKSEGKDLRAMIATTCRRLDERENFLESELERGVRLYRLKRTGGVSKPTPPVESSSSTKAE